MLKGGQVTDSYTSGRPPLPVWFVGIGTCVSFFHYFQEDEVR